MLKIQREQLYGGPMQRGKRFHFVAYLQGQSIATGATKEEAANVAEERLLGAFQCASNQGYCTVAEDGTICSTREYAPGEAEFTYHRGIDRFHGSFMGRLEIDGKKVTARDYHVHYVASYNEAVRPPMGTRLYADRQVGETDARVEV